MISITPNKGELNGKLFLYAFLFKQGFRRKNDERRRAGEWAVGRAGVNNSFTEPDSVRNILMILGRILGQVRAECRIQE